MALLQLDITKNWLTGTTVREINWDNIKDPLETWASTLIDDINQLRIDTQGASYSLDNDGLANLGGPIRDWTTGTSTLAWTFSGAVTFSSTVNFTGTVTLTLPQIHDTSSDHQYVFAVNELAADRTVTLPLLAGNDEFVFKDHAVTLANKTISSGVATGNFDLHSGADLRIYSDAGSTLKASIDGATGNVDTEGTLDVASTSIFRGTTDLYSGADLRVYSDAGTTLLFSVDGATGNIDAEGTLNILGVSTFQDDINVAALKKIYLDGGGDTYITENGADSVVFVTEGTTHLTLASGAGTSNLTLSNNTHLVGSAGSDFKLAATRKIYLDGGTDTYISEGAADRVDFTVGGTNRMSINGGSGIINVGGSCDFSVDAGKKLYLDNGGDTYISEEAADRVEIYAGGVRAFTVEESAAAIFINSRGQHKFGSQDPPTANYATQESIVKVWAAGTAGGASSADYNVSSMSRTSDPGQYQVVFDTNMSSANHVVIGQISEGNLGFFQAQARAKTDIDFLTKVTAGTLTNFPWQLMVIGTQE